LKLHIGNLSKDVSDGELNELVNTFGATTSVDIIRNPEGQSKGFGFVEYSDEAHARAAITGLDGKDVRGQALKVSEAKPRKGDNKPAEVAR
jgi:RNA recognition motif-containing protein